MEYPSYHARGLWGLLPLTSLGGVYPTPIRLLFSGFPSSCSGTKDCYNTLRSVDRLRDMQIGTPKPLKSCCGLVRIHFGYQKGGTPKGDGGFKSLRSDETGHLDEDPEQDDC